MPFAPSSVLVPSSKARSPDRSVLAIPVGKALNDATKNDSAQSTPPTIPAFEAQLEEAP